MGKSYFDLLDLRILILSRGRSGSITSHKLFPDHTLLVPESEEEEYRKATNYKGTIDTVPDEIEGLGPLRNWVLDHYDEEAIVMVDDDIHKLWVNSRTNGYAITDPAVIEEIIYSTALCAKGIGTSCFGFNQNWDVRKYKPTKPFALTGWVGGVIGVIGRDIHFCNNKFKVDVDFCLKAMLEDRVIWRDERFAFVQKRDSNAGGNAIFRTKDKVKKEIEHLSDKWGKHFEYKTTKTGSNTKTKVNRKQTITL